MKLVLKRVVGWARRTEAEKVMLRHRFQFIRYRALYLASHVFSLFPIPLVLILRICGSDKHKSGQHRYGYTYRKLFWPYKYKPIKLLEIGVGGYGVGLGGESLNAWQLYFPFAEIIGCDIHDKQRLATLNTKIYQLDQSSRDQLEMLAKLEEPFDIIIDDGSHLSSHQILSFEYLYSALSDGGVYIIEDVYTFGGTCIKYFINLQRYIAVNDLKDVDMGNRKLANWIKEIRFDGNLIIIIKGVNGTSGVENLAKSECRGKAAEEGRSLNSRVVAT